MSSGWNRSGGEVAKPTPKKPSALRGVIAGVAVVAAAVAVFFVLSGKDEKPKAKVEKEPGRIKEVKPAVITPKPVQAQAVEEVADDGCDSIHGTPIRCTTNASLGVICTVYRNAEGKCPKVYRPLKSQIFKHYTDMLLANALCSKGNGPIPPMPMVGDLDRAFRDSLKEPIVINKDDTPEVAARKQTVIDARTQIKELMDQGSSFSEILADHQKVFNENRDIRKEAARELQRIVDDGDTEGTRQYLLKVNLALQQMGIKELEEPKKSSVRRAEIVQRLTERAAAKEQGR